MLLQSLSHRETVISLSGLLSPWLTLREANRHAVSSPTEMPVGTNASPQASRRHLTPTVLENLLCQWTHSGFGSETSWS